MHCPITGSHWTSSLLFSLLQELVPLYDLSKGQLDGACSFTPIALNHLMRLNVMDRIFSGSDYREIQQIPS